MKNALNDWLKAEDEVLAEFVKARKQRHTAQPVSNETQTKTGASVVGNPPPASFIPAKENMNFQRKQ